MDGLGVVVADFILPFQLIQQRTFLKFQVASSSKKSNNDQVLFRLPMSKKIRMRRQSPNQNVLS